MTQLPSPSFLSRLAAGVWRVFVVGAWFVAGYIVIGSLLWPYWWYKFIWHGGFMRAESYRAMLHGVMQKPAGTLGVVFLLALLLFFFYIKQDQVAGFVGLHGGFSVILVSAFALVAVLSLTSTQKHHWQLEQNVYDAAQNLFKLLAPLDELLEHASQVLPEPPLAFDFLENDAVDSLFGQIQPEFTEAARSEKRSGTTGGKVSVGVASSGVAAESSTSSDETREFARSPSTPERRVYELIRYCLEHKRAAVVANRDLLVAYLEAEGLAKGLTLLRPCIRDIRSPDCANVLRNRPTLSFSSLKDEAVVRADEVLNSPPDLVLLVGGLSPMEARGGQREYSTRVTRARDVLTVIVLLPARVELPNPVGHAPIGLRVFGRVTNQTTTPTPRLTIRAVAVF